MIEFTIPGPPVGKGRPRVTRHGTYTPPKTREYEALVRACWREAGKGSYGPGVPLSMTIFAYFPIPKSVSKKKRAMMDGKRCVKKPDCDNIAKIVADSVNGCAYPDDAQIGCLLVYKCYTAGEPCVYVKITEAGKE